MYILQVPVATERFTSLNELVPPASKGIVSETPSVRNAVVRIVLPAGSRNVAVVPPPPLCCIRKALKFWDGIVIAPDELVETTSDASL